MKRSRRSLKACGEGRSGAQKAGSAKRAIAKAQAALDVAAKDHEANVAAIEKERALIDERAQSRKRSLDEITGALRERSP
jgi:colicin import membrane protein